MVRAAKNSFAPINRIPPEILSLLPDYRETDHQLVALTHVCRRWRDIFISCSPLWTSLGCTDLDKTHVYLERSKASPLGDPVQRDGTPAVFHPRVPADAPAHW